MVGLGKMRYQVTLLMTTSTAVKKRKKLNMKELEDFLKNENVVGVYIGKL